MSQNPTKPRADHDSDPARTPGDGWVGEGGASHLGPATHTGQEDRKSDGAEENDAEDTDEKDK